MKKYKAQIGDKSFILKVEDTRLNDLYAMGVLSDNDIADYERYLKKIKEDPQRNKWYIQELERDLEHTKKSLETAKRNIPKAENILKQMKQIVK